MRQTSVRAARAKRSPISSSKRRSWFAVLVGLAAVLTMPGAIVVAQQSKRVDLMDAAYGVPVGFLLGIVATGMARRAKRNLNWLRLDEGGSAVASLGIILGVLALAIAVACALSVGVYEGVLYYQRHYR
jgi:peptidoglycan/LPS O-acetylase OafA/YrhL